MMISRVAKLALSFRAVTVAKKPQFSQQLVTAFSTTPSVTAPAPEIEPSSEQLALEEEYSKEIRSVNKKAEIRQKFKQSIVGVVISTKSSKTINVEYAFRKYLQKYNLFHTQHRRVKAHDEKEEAKLGDVVRVGPSRPHSRTKRHHLLEIIRRPKSFAALPISIKQKV